VNARWSVTRLQRSLGANFAAWDALNERLHANHPLLTARFVDGLLKHFGSGQEHLCVCTADSGHAAAMCILRRSKPGVWASFLPSQAQLAPTLVPDVATIPALLRALPGLVLQLDLLCNDPLFGKLASACGPLLQASDHALTMNVDLSGNFEHYWEARSKQLRKNLRRQQKKLVDDGVEQKWALVVDAADMAAAVDRYAALEGRGWKGQAGTALASFPAQLAFYRELMLDHAAQGAACVAELWLGQRLAASRLIIAGESMAVILKTTYDETLQAYAPGRLLLHEVIRRAFVLWPGRCLEFYTNANADQLAWATGQRHIRHLTVYRNRLVRSTKAVQAGTLRRLSALKTRGSERNPQPDAARVRIAHEQAHPSS
jgi:CelD/BcsL family acetyltransferase involved in cellulose biosynthesis